jgi:hypothetical protein
MVRAILDGRKTQTRRALKGSLSVVEGVARWLYGKKIVSGGLQEVLSTLAFYHCPYGRPGDRLWVKEKWSAPALLDDDPPSDMDAWVMDSLGWRLWYSADDTMTEIKPPIIEGANRGRWRSSLHMPRTHCRILLEVVSVRVERLQEISEADAMAEGVIFTTPEQDEPAEAGGQPFRPARAAFRKLWESINGSWEANPWVWIVEFRRINA